MNSRPERLQICPPVGDAATFDAQRRRAGVEARLACSASCAPYNIAAPLPRLRATSSTCRPGSAAAMAGNVTSLPSSLPSITTQTGSHCARAARTVSNTLGPGL
jgi:hypothetical protein